MFNTVISEKVQDQGFIEDIVLTVNTLKFLGS